MVSCSVGYFSCVRFCALGCAFGQARAVPAPAREPSSINCFHRRRALDEPRNGFVWQQCHARTENCDAVLEMEKNVLREESTDGENGIPQGIAGILSMCAKTNHDRSFRVRPSVVTDSSRGETSTSRLTKARLVCSRKNLFAKFCRRDPNFRSIISGVEVFAMCSIRDSNFLTRD